jgi:hypothetical protein
MKCDFCKKRQSKFFINVYGRWNFCYACKAELDLRLSTWAGLACKKYSR